MEEKQFHFLSFPHPGSSSDSESRGTKSAEGPEFLSQRVAYDLRNLLYNHLQRLSYAFHDRSQTGQLMSRAKVDVDAVRMFVGFALIRGAYYSVLEGLILVHEGCIINHIPWRALFELIILAMLISAF